MDSRFIKVEMIVAIPDYGDKHALCVRDYMPDMTDNGFHEVTILDWNETDMALVDDEEETTDIDRKRP